MRSRLCDIVILLLLVVVTVMATEPVRPLCSRGRHPEYMPATSRSQGPRSCRVMEQKGVKRQLVFLVDFADLSFRDEDPETVWRNIFNMEHFDQPPFHGSVHDYFYDQSFGQLDLEFDIHYVHMDKEYKEYRSGDIDAYDDTRSGLLLTEILDMKKDEILDWSVYDWNGDGYINQVFILFAGKGQNNGGDKNTIWPHQWQLSSHADAPYNREWGHPYVVTSDSIDFLVDNYAIFSERSRSDSESTFGTLCHEYSHCLGLPDFYYVATSYVGQWDIMDYGNYNASGYCPPGYSAMERYYLGWLDFKELTEEQTIIGMGSISDGKEEAYLVRNDGYSNEFYVIENRQQTGWDKSLPSSGIIIFHIDYDEDDWVSGTPNTPSRQKYSIVHANNKKTQEGWPYPYEGNNELTNWSTPAAVVFHENTDSTLFMNKPITEMKVEGGLASFRFMDSTATVIERKMSQQSTVLYDFGPLYIIRNSQGEIKKVMKH